MNIPSGRRQIRMFLQRFGSKIDIYNENRQDRNSLNHPVENFEFVGTEYALFHWAGSIDEERDYESGRRVKLTPTVIVSFETELKDNNHVIRDGEEYEITAMTPRGNHYQADALLRTDGSLLEDE